MSHFDSAEDEDNLEDLKNESSKCKYVGLSLLRYLFLPLFSTLGLFIMLVPPVYANIQSIFDWKYGVICIILIFNFVINLILYLLSYNCFPVYKYK